MSDSGVAIAEDERGIGRAVVGGVIGGAIGVFLLVALGDWAVTGSFGQGAVLGAFCALWGGPGFGIMAGSAAHALRAERHLAVVPVGVTPVGATRDTGARPSTIPDSLSA